MSPTAITAAVVETGGAPFELTNVELGGRAVRRGAGADHGLGHLPHRPADRDGSFPTPMPVVLGHEGAGVVEEVGAAVTRVAVGDRGRVQLGLVRRVPGCATGRPNYCDRVLRAQLPGHARSTGRRRCRTTAAGPLALLRPVELRHGRDRARAQRGDDRRGRPVRGRRAVRVRRADRRRRRSSNVCARCRRSSLAVFGAGGVGLSAVMAAVICRLRADHRGRRAPRTADAGAGARRHRT